METCLKDPEQCLNALLTLPAAWNSIHSALHTITHTQKLDRSQSIDTIHLEPQYRYFLWWLIKAHCACMGDATYILWYIGIQPILSHQVTSKGTVTIATCKVQGTPATTVLYRTNRSHSCRSKFGYIYFLSLSASIVTSKGQSATAFISLHCTYPSPTTYPLTSTTTNGLLGGAGGLELKHTLQDP